jgi:hypothetical protein
MLLLQMRTLPAEVLNLIVVFQPLFTKLAWERANALLLGALLARGKCAVTACLRVVGWGDEKHFQNNHGNVKIEQAISFSHAEPLVYFAPLRRHTIHF